ncbi:hypothetical protein NP493_1750g00045 [Ridgeia piscesae]|uniref:Uncharacterized protein n=1 Tax=Ridgeia piscesae TaxID=27915 RepID=A0AAD9JUV9_RIDPI|nr:hypothetical protein NP493_1750g00045 [Ridgeia piscesae]
MSNKKIIKPLGKCRMLLSNPKTETSHDVKFIVIKDNDDCQPILGLQTSEQMHLVKVVVVKKRSDALRVRIDPHELNKALQCEHYTLPILEDVLHDFQGAFFSKADLCYWQVKLDDESRLLTFQRGVLEDTGGVVCLLAERCQVKCSKNIGIRLKNGVSTCVQDFTNDL